MLYRALIIVISIGCSLCSVAQEQPPKPSQDFTFEKVTPLGIDGVELESKHKPITFLASVTTDALVGMRRVELTSNAEEAGGMRSVVYDKGGQKVQSYPAQLRFRITASARDAITDDPFLPYKSDAEINALLLDLHFTLKSFDGIAEQVFVPLQVRHLGVPANITADERVYDVQFDVGNLPCERKLVLELRDGKGERLAKFHLELM